MDPEGGNDSQDITTASPNQQLGVRAFSPEQESALNTFKADIDTTIAQTNANMTSLTSTVTELMAEVRLLKQDRLDRQQTSSPVLHSIKTLPPAPPPAPPLPTASWSPYRSSLRAEDIGYFDLEFQAE